MLDLSILTEALTMQNRPFVVGTTKIFVRNCWTHFLTNFIIAGHGYH